MKQVYVLGVVLDLALSSAVGLTKKKGPVHLLNKITFPGGKLESGETPQFAVSREVTEEVGLNIPPENWKLFSTVETEEYTLYRLSALSNRVHEARQMESEPVEVLNIEFSLTDALKESEKYVSDFIQTLEGAIRSQVPEVPST